MSEKDDTTIEDIYHALVMDGYGDGARWLRDHIAAKDAEIARLEALKSTVLNSPKVETIWRGDEPQWIGASEELACEVIKADERHATVYAVPVEVLEEDEK